MQESKPELQTDSIYIHNVWPEDTASRYCLEVSVKTSAGEPFGQQSGNIQITSSLSGIHVRSNKTSDVTQREIST